MSKTIIRARAHAHTHTNFKIEIQLSCKKYDNCKNLNILQTSFAFVEAKRNDEHLLNFG